jgi:hypothetical protein
MQPYQLPLPLEADVVPHTTGPALDRRVIEALRNINVEYLWTSWSHYYQEWHHHLVVSTRASRHIVIKTDEGVAALLREHKR